MRSAALSPLFVVYSDPYRRTRCCPTVGRRPSRGHGDAASDTAIPASGLADAL